MRQVMLGLVVCVCACAGSQALDRVPPADVDDPAARADQIAPALDGYHAAYVLLWNGARIGEAREGFAAADDAEGGYRFERAERVVVRRGNSLVTAQTRIRIDTDVNLGARRVMIDRAVGSARTRAEATRMMDDGWRVAYGTSAARLVDGNAVPSTLVPLIAAGRGRTRGTAFEGPVLMEGSGLALARLRVDVSADLRVAHAALRTAAGELRAVAELDERGYIAAAGSSEGVASRRVDEAALAAAFDPPEIVDTSAVAVEGTRAAGAAGGDLRLEVAGVKAAPPALPQIENQTVAVGRGGIWEVKVDAQSSVPAWELKDIRERTGWVSRVLADDMGALSLSPEEALAIGRGDCTAHAIVLGKVLAERGYEARIVTGFILDEGALRRHRWVLVKVKRHWLAVDPMYDQVPATPAHLALAVTGSSADELAFVDDVAFAGWDGVTARYAP